MSVFEILGTLLLGPLKLIFECIFSLAYDILEHPGAAIIVLSLAMNVLVLPLYRRADAIQEAARDKENAMKDVVTHIKKTFSGDERMMILQAYYRQQNYSPLSALSGTLSLLLEIPFFMAAYQFLSGVGLFQGASLGPISDLSAPDGLLTIGSFSVNVLPIIMTVINVVSSSLYLKGFPLKTKIQLYGMALFFLVFLYNSPAALVFYWTLNNTFSLFKTLYYKIKNSRTILNILLAVTGGALVVLSLLFLHGGNGLVVMGLGLVMQLPWVLPLLKKKLPRLQSKEEPKVNTKLFFAGAFFLTVLIGLLIPSTFISASTQEFIDPNYFYNPTWYIIYTLCLAAGFFLVWLGVFYWLANPRGKAFFGKALWILSGVLIVNYMFFGTNLGIVTADLVYTAGLNISKMQKLLNLGVILALAAGLFLLVKYFPKPLSSVLLIGAVALLCMGTVNTYRVNKDALETRERLRRSDDPMPEINLSTDGNNVVVIMLDRGLGNMIPYIMEENPELKQQLDGFTWYSNTLSYGPSTNFTTPSLYGGYDYTPVAMNKRDDMLLGDKHDEALKVVPTLMAEEGYEVSVIDPPFAGYNWTSDLSIYDDIEGVTAYNAAGKFSDLADRIRSVETRQRNFFLFSAMKTLPLCIQSAVYDDGIYNAVPSGDTGSNNLSNGFTYHYSVLQNMDTITTYTRDDRDTYLIMRNLATHEPVILQEPDYTVSATVDNSAYYPPEGKTVSDGTNTLLLSSPNAIASYHANVASLKALGNWFDAMRDAGVYDNTRIILVSDHGNSLGLFDSVMGFHSMEFYSALLMVKDFHATGYTTDTEFMTNADVAALSMEGLIQSPVNPFTGNPITTDSKNPQEEQYIIVSGKYQIDENNGTQFLSSQWATVSGNIHDKNNWTFYEDTTIMPPPLEENTD